MATKSTKKAPAKKAPAKKAAVKTTKAKAEASAGRRGRPPSYNPEGTFTVAEPDAVKRGVFRQMVDAALSVGKKFTLPELQAACKKIEFGENQFQTTFNFGVRKGVFAQA